VGIKRVGIAVGGGNGLKAEVGLPRMVPKRKTINTIPTNISIERISQNESFIPAAFPVPGCQYIRNPA
jgi:hypothetical protein